MNSTILNLNNSTEPEKKYLPIAFIIIILLLLGGFIGFDYVFGFGLLDRLQYRDRNIEALIWTDCSSRDVTVNQCPNGDYAVNNAVNKDPIMVINRHGFHLYNVNFEGIRETSLLYYWRRITLQQIGCSSDQMVNVCRQRGYTK